MRVRESRVEVPDEEGNAHLGNPGFHVFGALAEFERDLIRERTLAGLAARARGRKGGRPLNLDDKKKRHAVTLHGDPSNSVKDICRTLGISKATLYRYLAKQRRQ